jgi:hypothetical protein
MSVSEKMVASMLLEANKKMSIRQAVKVIINIRKGAK